MEISWHKPSHSIVSEEYSNYARAFAGNATTPFTVEISWLVCSICFIPTFKNEYSIRSQVTEASEIAFSNLPLSFCRNLPATGQVRCKCTLSVREGNYSYLLWSQIELVSRMSDEVRWRAYISECFCWQLFGIRIDTDSSIDRTREEWQPPDVHPIWRLLNCVGFVDNQWTEQMSPLHRTIETFSSQ